MDSSHRLDFAEPQKFQRKHYPETPLSFSFTIEQAVKWNVLLSTINEIIREAYNVFKDGEFVGQ